MMKYLLLISAVSAMVFQATAEDLASPERFNVVFAGPSKSSLGSMPLGNGDIGLNVWTVENGEIVFYIAKTDTWDAKGELMKVGRVHLAFNPAFQAAASTQTLSLADGSIVVSGTCGKGDMRVKLWVDANRPRIHVEALSQAPVAMTAKCDLWRMEMGAMAGQANRVLWYQANGKTQAPMPVGGGNPDPYSDRRFGCLMKGPGMTVVGNGIAMQSNASAKTNSLSVDVLSKQTPDDKEYVAALEAIESTNSAVSLEAAWAGHVQWWASFWNRSWIRISSKTDAANAATVERAYALQRFVTACAGRGAFPIKFNGSLFTMDMVRPWESADTIRELNGDARGWGGCYWFQNTRLIYWPLMASGDFEMMEPLFKMYTGLIPTLNNRCQRKFNHAGAEFCETISVSGADHNCNSYIDQQWNGALELIAMALDDYEYTGDARVLDDYVLPLSKAFIAFFGNHFKREGGKLLMTPEHALETYWEVVDPTPDVAGLHWDLERLLRLPETKVGGELRAQWTRLLSELPAIPTTTNDWAAPYRSVDGKLAYPFPPAAKLGAVCIPPARILMKGWCNSENPELYAVFPYRLYGAGKPDLEIGRETFARRLYRANYCWWQDNIHAACLGLAQEARVGLTARAAPATQCRFPVFWGPGNDYTPDEDHGGVLMSALQMMVLQGDNGKLLMLPAWSKEWDLDFKLHAFGGRTVEGSVRDGKLGKLNVEPALPKEAILICDPQ